MSLQGEDTRSGLALFVLLELGRFPVYLTLCKKLLSGSNPEMSRAIESARSFKFSDTPFMLQQCIYKNCRSRNLSTHGTWFSASLKVPEHCEQLAAT